MLRADRILPVIFFAFLGFMYYLTYDIRSHEFGLLGPSFYPRMIIIVMVLLLAGIVIEGFIKEKKEIERGGKPYKGVTLSEGVIRYFHVILIFVLTIVYILLLKQLGYVIDTVLYLVGMALLLKPDWKKGLPFMVSFMVVFTLALYYIFTSLLEVALPSGRLF